MKRRAALSFCRLINMIFRRSRVCCVLLVCCGFGAGAQNLSFTPPQNLLPDASTDKAIDITNFKGGFFVTWKQTGDYGAVHVSYLGRHYDTSYVHREVALPEEQTAFAPVLRVLGDRLYLFWIDKEGALKYIVNGSDTGWGTAAVHQLSFGGKAGEAVRTNDGIRLGYGVTSAAIGGKLLLASHAADREHLVYALVTPGPDGLFPAATLQKIPGSSSADYPFVVSLNDTMARFCWRGFKEQTVYCADYSARSDAWKPAVAVGQARSKTAPAIYRVWSQSGSDAGVPGTGKLFYIWRGPDKDKRLYYSASTGAAVPQRQTLLPGFFTTSHPVSICIVNDNTFILAYTGDDGRLYLSYFANYNPASWMKDLLLPSKSGYTLQDIVLPGAHDAGMSVLSGVGGSQSGTINNCNTLTQILPVSGQLAAGIRMFDLRVGTFSGELYTKHCSSDCMADAIGGGYGEKLNAVLDAIRGFLVKNKGEVVLLTFSHFCERETPVNELASAILNRLGKDIVYRGADGAGSPAGPAVNGELLSVPLRQLAGKVIVTFEKYARADGSIDSCTIAEHSNAPVNFRREYAATDEIAKFLGKEEVFFHQLSDGVHKNDLVRLDWQLTQSSDEAAMTCNDFQDEKANPLVSGAMLLTNVIRRHQSIIDLSVDGNKYLPLKLNEWIGKGVINKKNKPNIVYVDAAGGWITDYCIGLNNSDLYRK